MNVLSGVGCRTTQEHVKIFNPEGIYVISRSRGEVELYSKNKGTNSFSYFGWKNLSILEGYSITLVDWTKEND